MQIGRRTLGFQFHLETTPESAALLDELKITGEMLTQMAARLPEHVDAVSALLT